MDYEDILLKKNARELQIKIRMMKDNTFNIYKDRLVEINRILTDNSFRENLKFMTLVNMKKLVENGDSFKQWRDASNRKDLLQDLTLHIDPNGLNEKVARAMPWVKEDMNKIKSTLDEWTEDLLRVAWKNHPKWKKKQKESDFDDFKSKAKQTVFKSQRHYSTGEDVEALYAKRKLETSDGRDNTLRIWRKVGIDKYDRGQRRAAPKPRSGCCCGG